MIDLDRPDPSAYLYGAQSITPLQSLHDPYPTVVRANYRRARTTPFPGYRIIQLVRLLSENNTSYNLTTIITISDNYRAIDASLTIAIPDFRYCVLDYSNRRDVDFRFVSPQTIDVFARPVANLRIGSYRIQMPIDWSIVIADKNFGSMEIIALKSLNERPFEALLYNPIDGFMPSFGQVSIEAIGATVAWNIPKLKVGHILAVPVSDQPRPLCAFFVREGSKLRDVLDITKIFP